MARAPRRWLPLPSRRTRSGVALTRRGWLALVAAAAGVALAWRYGARSINAVVVPTLVALGAGYLQVRLREPPTVRRDLPPDGAPGDGGTVTLSVETGSPYGAVVRDALPDGVDGDPTVETTVGLDPAEYEIEYRARGVYEVGPAEIVARDVLGLVSRRLTATGTDRLVVYPRVRRLTGEATAALVGAGDAGRNSDREEFDRLRSYDRGDALRDVDWKSTARHDELLVKEFTAGTARRPVTVAASATTPPDDGRRGDPDRDAGDRMAEAAASVCVTLLDAGVPVRLSTPDGTVEAAPGDRTAVLEHLAGATTGGRDEGDDDDRDDGARGDAVDRRARAAHGDGREASAHRGDGRAGSDRYGPGGGDADVRVHATVQDVRVTVGGTTRRFQRLLDDATGEVGGGAAAGATDVATAAEKTGGAATRGGGER